MSLTNARETLPNPNGAPFKIPRPIRFVSNTNEPPTKRRRVGAACRTCRRRKTRCSGEKPDCKTCSDLGQTCEGYPEATRNGPNVAIAQQSRGQREATYHGVSHTADQPLPLPQRSMDSPSSDQHITASQVGPPPGDNYARSPEKAQNDRNPLAEENAPPSPSHTSRVPYFRYFGPTAIVPGFKEMVTEVDNAHIRESPESHRASQGNVNVAPPETIMCPPGKTPASDSDPETQFYDATDSKPISPLVEHLCEVFFTHLGCNYPFLDREQFMQDLRGKKVDAVLVDAICAISARFSTHPSLTNSGSNVKDIDRPKTPQLHKSKHGCIFAKRARSRVTESFACPSIAASQACLLLAYEQFGSDHDSGLWVWLGISIRLAQDLGLQKGPRREACNHHSPNLPMIGTTDEIGEQAVMGDRYSLGGRTNSDPSKMTEKQLLEKKRNDTFWAVFFLDRYVSSGTGRPVALRDTDIEVPFPPADEEDAVTGWPAPFPTLIRIIHLYGRVTDLLNSIHEVNHLTPDTLQRLAALESELTGLYQRMSTKLHFNAGNFQHYAKGREGTNFILLHFWFHTLIVLLHQPTLLHPLKGRIQQLFPNSRELALSSAKTIADIFTFAELIDSRSFVGNPFTSQPMYIAACAFLLESASHVSAASRPRTPEEPLQSPPNLESPSSLAQEREAENPAQSSETRESNSMKSGQTQAGSTKHALLATAANQDYQRCYKALKLLERYWAGTKYIVCVLDQKAKGVLDPLLYKIEDLSSVAQTSDTKHVGASPISRPNTVSRPSSATSAAGYLANLSRLKPGNNSMTPNENLSKLDLSQAFGWSVTGTSNSPTPNLSVLYSNSPERGARGPLPSAEPPSMPKIAPSQTADPAAGHKHSALNREHFLDDATKTTGPDDHSSRMSNLPPHDATFQQAGMHHSSSYVNVPTNMPRPTTSNQMPDGAETEVIHGGDGLGHTTSPFAPNLPLGSTSNYETPYQQESFLPNAYDYGQSHPADGHMSMMNTIGPGFGDNTLMDSPFNSMTIESHDIDTSALGEDMMLWLDHLPPDAQYLFDPQNPNMPDYRDVG